jgi:hypothetical protein
MLPLITAQTVVSKWIRRTDFAVKNTWRAKLKPLDIERELRDDLYLIVFSAHMEELELPTMEGWPVVLAYLGSGRLCRKRMRESLDAARLLMQRAVRTS